MADAAMASAPSFGGPQGDFEAALKFAAAQADQLQDDPNFYSWLEDWIGKQDEESAMLDAFNTLNDYNMQFEFQQQQQQDQLQQQSDPQSLQQQQQRAGSPAGAVGSQGPSSSGTPALGPGSGAMEAALNVSSSSCASMASHPSSHPSEDSNTLPVVGSPSESADHSSCRPALPSPTCPANTDPGLSTHPQAQAAPDACGLLSLLSGGGTIAAASATAAAAAGRGAPLPPCSAAAGPCGVPATGGMAALLSDPAGFFARAAAASGANLNLSPLGLHAGADMERMPSHGTVTSFAGTPPQGPLPWASGARPAGQAGTAPATDPAPFATAALPAQTAAVATAAAPAAARPAAAPGRLLTGIGGGVPGGVPSLEQLIARAIVGNGSGTGLRHSGSGSGHASASGSRSASGCAAGLTPTDALLARHDSTSGTFSESLAAATRGSGQQTDPALAAAHGCSGAAGPRKSSSLGLGLGAADVAHHRGSGSGAGGAAGGLAAALALRHGHVEKLAAAGGPGGARGGGVNAVGRPTRSARAKAVFAALEAEVAEKLGELEALRSEHTTLTQRVEILESAVQRQNAVLSLMAGKDGGGGAAAAASCCGAGGPTEAASGLVAAAIAAAAAGYRVPGFSAALPGALGQRLGGGLGPQWGRWGVPDPIGAVMSGTGGAEVLEWAWRCSVEECAAWYKEHLQQLSLALLALDSSPTPEADAQLVQLVAGGCARMSLLSVFQPLVQLRLKGFNLETGGHSEPSEAHWLQVIRFMSVGPEQVAEMENLFHSYTLLHGSFRAELQDTQGELAELAAASERLKREDRVCSEPALAAVIKQAALMKRVRSILQKTHLLYSCTLGVAATRILKPKEFAKCCVQSYPYFPCGPSLMKACTQFKMLKTIFGAQICCPTA